MRPSLPFATTLCLVLLGAGLALPPGAAAQTSFVAFESGPVRPIALSPSGGRLFAVNTPDNQLEVFTVSAAGLARTKSIPVGMEPVAVAARSDDEVWVVNHLSDSVSIVDVPSGRVVRTLLVGDEPRDIVFAGSGGNRAFITTAHRGQHRTDESIEDAPGAGDPQLTTEGVGRADVWVFDATALGSAFGGDPVRILTFFADTPRALAASPDGSTVYAAAFHSGNQTTAVTETQVPDGFDSAPPGGGAPGGVPGPDDNADGVAAPETGIIVKFDGAAWRDSLGRDWTAKIKLSLPDHDVFAIDADTLSSGSVVEFDHVGTILFNMVVNPVTGKVYVTNTELPNHVRFEGPGEHGGSTVQGRLSLSRVTVIDPLGLTVDPQHLNQHIDYSRLHTDAPDLVDPSQKDHSLATPLQPVVSSDGSTLYVAAFGSGKVGVFSTAAIEDVNFETNFDPTTASAQYLDVPGGPAGLALDETNDRLYVLTRFDDSVAVIDLGTGSETNRIPLHNPEPASIVEGRPFLYDATFSSGNGEASCSSCHIFADFDSLAWDLGNPDDATSSNTQPSATILPPATTFHPMKGPMTTQTLRGLGTHGGMHWRGDRVDGFFGTDPCTEPSGAPCDEDLSFNNFIVAFEGLVGRDGIPTPAEMQAFTDFILQVQLPPNPVGELDNSLTPAQGAGQTLFNGAITDVVANCNGCHTLDPAQGFFGTGGEQSFEGEPQNFKVAHMRNLYAKVGMFGDTTKPAHLGDQVRGFGFLHDGSIDTVATFLSAPVFNLNATQEANLEQFSLAFPTDLAPIVGQQVTLAGAGSDDTNARITLLLQRAGHAFSSLVLGGAVTECDLVVKGVVDGVARGFVYRPGLGHFQSDQLGETIGDAALRAKALTAGQELTYTCVPPGSGDRAGIDRDEDGVLDFDELADFTDPGNPGSVLGACSDAIDNDGDGLVDAADPGCAGGGSPDTENPQCDDGWDNDNDGLADLADPQCLSSSSNLEKAATGCGLTGAEPLALLGLIALARERRRRR